MQRRALGSGFNAWRRRAAAVGGGGCDRVSSAHPTVRPARRSPPVRGAARPASPSTVGQLDSSMTLDDRRRVSDDRRQRLPFATCGRRVATPTTRGRGFGLARCRFFLRLGAAPAQKEERHFSPICRVRGRYRSHLPCHFRYNLCISFVTETGTRPDIHRHLHNFEKGIYTDPRVACGAVPARLVDALHGF